jgi:hypothetical protein
MLFGLIPFLMFSARCRAQASRACSLPWEWVIEGPSWEAWGAAGAALASSGRMANRIVNFILVAEDWIEVIK